MPPTNPRIIVVDVRQNLHQMVRAALELMGRRPRLIETYSSDDALQELQIRMPDVLITGQTLEGSMDGPMLAVSAKREMAALPIIVVGSEDDPQLDDESGARALFQYLRRPLAPELFIRALRIALDGPESAPKEVNTEEDFLPVPVIEPAKLHETMFRLMREVGAMAIVLADRNGKVLTYEGAAGYMDRDMLAAALGPGFNTALKIMPVIGDQPRVLKYYDGERSNLFALAVGLHHYVMLFFEGRPPAAALGNVKRFGYAAINEMLNIIGPIAFETRRAAIAKPPEPKVTQTKRRTRTQEMAGIKAAQVAPPAADRQSRQETTVAADATIDASIFDQLDNVDMSEADALFDPNRLRSGDGTGDRISFEDALLQGIIGDINE